MQCNAISVHTVPIPSTSVPAAMVGSRLLVALSTFVLSTSAFYLPGLAPTNFCTKEVKSANTKANCKVSQECNRNAHALYSGEADGGRIYSVLKLLLVLFLRRKCLFTSTSSIQWKRSSLMSIPGNAHHLCTPSCLTTFSFLLYSLHSSVLISVYRMMQKVK